MSTEAMRGAIKLSAEGKREEAKAAVTAILDAKKNTLLGDAKAFIKQNLFKSG